MQNRLQNFPTAIGDNAAKCLKRFGGGYRNRTDLHGFAILLRLLNFKGNIAKTCRKPPFEYQGLMANCKTT